MLHTYFLWMCYAIFYSTKTTASQVFGLDINITAKSNSSFAHQNNSEPSNLGPLLSDIPEPSSNQTIGSYFEALLGAILRPRHLTERHLFRSEDQTLLTSSWAQDQGYFNVSLDRCLEFKTVAGVYTSRDGTRDNATILDINKDLRFRSATVMDTEYGIGSRVLDNAQRALIEADMYLQNAICGHNAGTNVHDELRHLLAPDGYWITLMTKSALYSSVSASIYTGILNRNASIGQAIGVTIGAAGLAIADGIITRLQVNGRMSFLEATIINTFTAWFRRAVQVGSDSQGSACISEIIVHDALGSLADSSDSSFYFDALSQLEIERECHR